MPERLYKIRISNQKWQKFHRSTFSLLAVSAILSYLYVTILPNHRGVSVPFPFKEMDSHLSIMQFRATNKVASFFLVFIPIRLASFALELDQSTRATSYCAFRIEMKLFKASIEMKLHLILAYSTKLDWVSKGCNKVTHCPWKLILGANSPNLCPTIQSVI